MPATAQGSAAGKPLGSACAVGVGAAAAPAGVPQRWQNFAPGVSGTRQVEQTAPSSGAPQLAQKRPDAGAAQLGQVVEGGAGGVVDDMTSVNGAGASALDASVRGVNASGCAVTGDLLARNLHRWRRSGDRAPSETSL
ncbi:MAG TPA: hypothetical protein VFK04_08785 [Gemmatimonadaceae bacterium]|nr:hypothetical protein [Gemmatimonadaceae bacterium]